MPKPGEPASYRATFTLGEEGAKRLAARLNEAFWPPPDAVGVFEEGCNCWRVEAYFAAAPDREALIRFACGQVPVLTELSIRRVPVADWVALSQAKLHPVRAGRFTVHGRHDRSRLPASRWRIEIDAGQAFGTAHHGSTRGCLLALDALAKRQRLRRVLDLGTGTGVLALAAARAWRARVTASDSDPTAVTIARENAARNGVAGQVATVCADGLAHPRIRLERPYDLIVANILARPLAAIANAVMRAVRPGGVVVLSGMTHDQAARVEAAYRAAGAMTVGRTALGQWVTLTLRRRLRLQVAMPSASSRASAFGSKSARSSAVTSILSRRLGATDRAGGTLRSRRLTCRSSQASNCAS